MQGAVPKVWGCLLQHHLTDYALNSALEQRVFYTLHHRLSQRPEKNIRTEEKLNTTVFETAINKKRETSCHRQLSQQAVNNHGSHPLLSQLQNGIFQMNSLVCAGPLLFSLHCLTGFLLLGYMDSYFILATKHLWFTLVKVGLLQSVWRGLDWWGRKATISDLRI